MVDQRPTTDLLNSEEFGCSEENLSCSGGYAELIYSGASTHTLRIGPEAQSGGLKKVHKIKIFFNIEPIFPPKLHILAIKCQKSFQSHAKVS